MLETFRPLIEAAAVLFEEVAGDFDRLTQQTAGVVSKVQNKCLNAVFSPFFEGLFQLIIGLLGETADTDVSRLVSQAFVLHRLDGGDFPS